MTRIYIHWRCAARREPAAHRRRSKPARPSKIDEYFPGFPISRGAR